jgi:hypothetical protein
MDLRYCERCGAEVQDAGGYCLLGHPLRLDPVIASVSEWRQELDRAFDEARPDQDLEADADAVEQEPPRRSLWATLGQSDGVVGNDPISAFAPAARMDWGPEERSGFLARSLRRGRPAHA